MATYDITLLQSNMQPVAAGIAVQLFANPTPSMSPAQITAFVSANTPAASGTTDANGHFQAALTAGTSYLAAPTGYNGVYLAPQASPTALFATVFVPTNLCKVTGQILGPDGTPQAKVTVTANLNASGPVQGSAIILASAPSVTTDANGNWELDLMPNDLIEPKNTLYTIVFTQPASQVPAYPFFSFGQPVKPHGPSVSYVVEVPNAATAAFASLID